jgi:hypothetical protein
MFHWTSQSLGLTTVLLLVSAAASSRPPNLVPARGAVVPETLGPAVVAFLDGFISDGLPGELSVVHTTLDSIADMASVLKDRCLVLTPLPHSLALAFPVRTWDQISWTGSAGPGHRALFEDRSLVERRPFWGVIARVLASDGIIVPMLLLWQEDPVDGPPSSWKLLTMLPIAVW